MGLPSGFVRLGFYPQRDLCWGIPQASGATNVSEAVKQSFNNMRIIVSLGWAIYPAGYFLGQVNKSASAAQALNVTYNIADFVNKIAFVLACWSCAKSDSEGRKSEPLLA